MATGSIVVTCSARAGALDGDCGEIHFRLVTEDDETVSMTATVRTGEAVGGSAPPVYVSPDVSITSPAPVPPSEAVIVYRGEPVTFAASSSQEGGGALTHHWDFGDGTLPSTDDDPTYAYTDLGSFTAIYTATNSDGTPASDYVRITVKNRDPFAIISVPLGDLTTNRCTPEPFSGENSHDGDDAAFNEDPLGYTWDFGDDTSSSAANPTHQFQTLGNLTVGLTVTDEDGGWDSETRSVMVQNRPPKISVLTANGESESLSGHSPLDVTFNATASDDDDCPGSNEILTYAWDFGDGGTSSEPNPTHVYETGGSFTATLTVTDSADESISDSIIVNVNTSPSADFVMNTDTIRVGMDTPAGWITNDSTDSEGHPMTAEWSFENGTPSSSTSWDPPPVNFMPDVVGGDAPFLSQDFTVGLLVTDEPPPPSSPGSSYVDETVTVTGAPAPTGLDKVSDRRKCVLQIPFFCLNYHYWNTFGWNASPAPIDEYELHVRWEDCVFGFCSTENSFHTTTDTSIELWEHGAQGGNATIRVRARDGSVHRWGYWSGWKNVYFRG